MPKRYMYWRNSSIYIASREDYVISWWDYGYPIRYYADVKTLVDGGKHSGSVNFPVSFMLTNPQQVAAKMARLDVEYTEKTNELKKEIADKNITVFSNIEQMTKSYGFDDTNKFLEALKDPNLTLPKKTRDIYFYLPFRMLSIYPTIALFSNLDLMTGRQKKPPFLNVQLVDMTSNLNVIYMASYGSMLIVDDRTYDSLTIQLLVLENYDPKLFEPVMLTPYVKVYKLKE